ncbi:hypothetical protein M3J09_003426 [Ascochyta lentis]
MWIPRHDGSSRFSFPQCELKSLFPAGAVVCPGYVSGGVCVHCTSAGHEMTMGREHGVLTCLAPLCLPTAVVTGHVALSPHPVAMQSRLHTLQASCSADPGSLRPSKGIPVPEIAPLPPVV